MDRCFSYTLRNMLILCWWFLYLMIRRSTRSSRTHTLFPSTTPFLSVALGVVLDANGHGDGGDRRVGGGVDEQRIAIGRRVGGGRRRDGGAGTGRSEEHTSELQSLMRISYAVFCLKKKNIRSLIRTAIL